MNDQERGTNNQDEVTKAKAEVQQEIKEARAKPTATEASAAEKILAEKYLNELKDRSTASREVVDMDKIKGNIDTKRKEAISVKVTLVKVLEAVKEGIIDRPTKIKTILTTLAVNGGLTDTTASYLQPVLQKYINRDISFSKAGKELTEFERDFRQLRRDNPNAARILGQVLTEKIGELGDINEDDLKSQLEMGRDQNGEIIFPEEEEKKRMVERYREMQEDPNFANDWERVFNIFYTEEDKELVKALYSVDSFKDYLLKKRDEITSKHPGINEEELMYELSEEIETEIVLTYSKLFTRVDLERPTEIFHEIIQQGFFNSIQIAHQTFKTRLELLARDIEIQADDEILKKFKFTKKYSREELHTKKAILDIDEAKAEKQIPYYKVYPLARLKTNVSLKEFLQGVYVELGHEFEVRGFLHNVRALFLKGPQKDGFWPQIAHYAEEMKSTDIDSIIGLPDNDIFMTAFRLYQKYMEETFAFNNWIHISNMFSPDMAEIYTKIEQKVMAALKTIYPDQLGGANIAVDGKMTRRDWRLRRALTMAVGLARGILLTEPETASWADPHITQEEGSPTFFSYYTNDNIALNGLNPLHNYLRFFTESMSQGPLLFMLTTGFKPNLLQGWDHRELWDKMNDFFKSFMNGQAVLHPDNPKERTIFEMLPNIMNVGSIVTRGGWRINAALDAWFQYKGGKKEVTRNLDILKTWQTIEGIGYEALYAFVNNKVSGNSDFLLAKNDYESKDRDDFINYLYVNYINPGGNTAQINTMLGNYEKEATIIVDDLIKEGKILKRDRNEAIEKEKYRKFIYRGLVGVLVKRLPTKFIRLDRDRFSKNGIRSWEKIRQLSGLDHEEFDRVMRDLLLVETRLRQETSEKIRDYIRKQEMKDEKEVGSPLGFNLNEYVVTESLIKRYITDSEKSKEVINLFNLIKNNYLNDNSYLDQFADDIRPQDAAGFIVSSKKFPFAIATEELDISLLAYRFSGERTLARATGDIGAAETVVFAEIQKIMQSLRPISLDDKRDFMPFVESLDKIKTEIEGRINKDVAHKVVSHIASIIISYYKKDTVARNLLTKYFTYGKPHSLAAEFAPGLSNVWEWEVGDIDKFIYELGRKRIIPREPYDLKLGPAWRVEEVKNEFLSKLFGKEKKTRRKVKRAPDYEFYEGKFRKDFGVTGTHKAWEMINTIVPFFLIYLLWKFIQQSLQESEGRKK